LNVTFNVGARGRAKKEKDTRKISRISGRTNAALMAGIGNPPLGILENRETEGCRNIINSWCESTGF
jgi:hypothetical protein